MIKAILDNKSPWRILAPMGLCLILSLSGDLTLYTILPVHTQEVGLALVDLGLIFSANRLIRFISNPLVGAWIDHWGRRRLIIVGLGSGTLSTLMYISGGGFWSFLVARLLWGVSWSMIYISSYAMVLDITKQSDRGHYLGILQFFYFIGFMINSFLGGLLSDRIGFVPTISICAMLTAVGFIIAIIFLPETYKVGGLVKIESILDSLHTGAGDLLTNLKKVSISTVRRNGELILTNYLYFLIFFVGEGMIMSTITLYIQFHVDKTLKTVWGLQVASFSGILLAGRALISAVTAPFAGFLSDRFKNRWFFVFIGMLLGVVGLLIIVVGKKPFWIGMGMALAAVNTGVVITILPAYIGDVTGTQQRGKVMGVLTTAGDLGAAIAPLTCYSLLAMVSLEELYWFSSAMLVSGVLLILLILWKKKKKPYDCKSRIYDKV